MEEGKLKRFLRRKLNSSTEVKGVLKATKSSYLFRGCSWLSSDVLKVTFHASRVKSNDNF